MPVIIAGQANVVPSQRRDIPEQVRVGQSTLTPQIVGGLVHVARVPVDDGGDDEVQSHDAPLLSGVGTIMCTEADTDVDALSNPRPWT